MVDHFGCLGYRLFEIDSRVVEPAFAGEQLAQMVVGFSFGNVLGVPTTGVLKSLSRIVVDYRHSQGVAHVEVEFLEQSLKVGLKRGLEVGGGIATRSTKVEEAVELALSSGSLEQQIVRQRPGLRIEAVLIGPPYLFRPHFKEPVQRNQCRVLEKPDMSTDSAPDPYRLAAIPNLNGGVEFRDALAQPARP